MPADLLVNIDVPDLEHAVAFYTQAFGLAVTRRFGTAGAELSGWPVRLYLLQKSEGSIGAAESPRRYDRHWTPVHLDVVVDDLHAVLARAAAAGARTESEIRTEVWGKIVVLLVALAQHDRFQGFDRGAPSVGCVRVITKFSHGRNPSS